MKRSISYPPSLPGGEIARTTILCVKSGISLAKSIDPRHERLLINDIHFILRLFTCCSACQGLWIPSSILLLRLPSEWLAYLTSHWYIDRTGSAPLFYSTCNNLARGFGSLTAHWFMDITGVCPCRIRAHAPIAPTTQPPKRLILLLLKFNYISFCSSTMLSFFFLYFLIRYILQ